MTLSYWILPAAAAAIHDKNPRWSSVYQPESKNDYNLFDMTTRLIYQTVDAWSFVVLISFDIYFHFPPFYEGGMHVNIDVNVPDYKGSIMPFCELGIVCSS